MKKLFLLIICAVLTIGARAQFSGSGNGTEEDPYRIYTDIHFAQMANFLNQEGVVFELMKDVDLSSYISENSPSQGWVPIGVESTPFKGVLKGNNHTISGLYINRASTNNVGLFGYVTGATIENLTVKASSIIGSTNVGTLVGYVSGTTFTNCTVNVSSANGVKATDYIGGMVGRSLSCTFSNCGYTGNINATGSTGYVGGFIGHASSGSLTDCNITSTVNAKAYCGGVIGSAVGVNLTNVTMRGNVNGTTSVGGIVGYATNASTWTNVNYYGNIAGSANVAGVVGELSGASVNFISAYSKGKITNTGDYTGGIVAKSNGGCIAGMENSSHFGDIEGKDYVGGIVGAILNIVAAPTLHTYYISNSSTTNNKNYGPYYDEMVNGSSNTNSINNCTAIGNISGSEFVGGMIGKDEVATGYTSSSTRVSPTNYYVWIDGAYSGHYDYVYTITYSKNITNILLTNSFYSGNINGASNVGGLIGHKEGGSITNCYTYATIAGESNIGGIAGAVTGSVVSSSSFSLTLKSNVAINSSITATSSNVGRIFGNRGDAVTIGALASAEGNRALTQTKVMLCGVAQDVIDDEQNGTSVGPSMLRLKANYVSWGWNFDDNWNILETECYPYKKYQAAPPVIESALQSQDSEISGKSLNGGTVYMYYKDRDAVSTDCDGYNWTFSTEALQSGAQVQLYADVEGMTPSYLASATVKFPGSGTEDDPYRIYTAEDLQGATNSGYYKLMNDIDLTSWINENSPVKGWPSIGRNSSVATYINGDGHKVTGLWINTTEGYNGLFSNYSAGYIKNLNVEVANGKKVEGGDYTGILIGRMANGQIINCSVKGDVEGTLHVGGVSGYVTNSSVSNSAFEGKVNTTASNVFAGGIAGLADEVETTSCRSNATITTTGEGSCVGGLYGKTNNGSVTKSTADAKITASGSSNYVGGLVGHITSPITLSYSTGTVAASGTDSYTGGLVGYAEASIANSYSTANVSGTQFTAGLVAYTFNSVDKCYASGNVAGVMYGAGLIGELDGPNASATNCVAANNKLELTAQSAWGCRVIGGFKSGCAEPNNSNYALNTMQVSLNNVPVKKTDDTIEGIAKTAAELQSSETYLGINWNLSKDWSLEESSTYPFLLWEVDVNPIVDITLDKTSLIVSVGNTATLSASILPLSATNKRVEWTSSNTAIATVENGVVTAVGQGSAIITASTTDGSNLSAKCTVSVVANHDDVIAELETLVNKAQTLYDNSKEGNNIGQYAPGSRAVLLSAIKDVKSKISSTMSEEEIASCTTAINNAIETFKGKMVSAGEDTDVSQYDNVVYVNKVEGRPGSQVTLSVQMDNVAPVYGYEFRLHLPEGVTVATETDAYGDTNPMVTLSTGRTSATRHTFESSLNEQGMLTVLCYSTKKYTFLNNSGEVAQIVLNVSDDVVAGDYPIIIKGEAVSLENATPEIEYIKSTLTISDFKLGDANGDTKVNVGDITAVAGYILGSPSDNFVFKGADANEDNKVNVGDITTIASMILDGTANNAKARIAMAECAAEFYLDDAVMERGNDVVIPVFVNNTESAFSSFQFDVNLPAGFNMKSVSANADRIKLDCLQYADMGDGVCRVLGYSIKERMVRGTEGALVYMTLSADEALDDTYDLSISNGVFAKGTSTIETSEVKAVITVADATSISGISSANQKVTVYDVNGRAVKTGVKASGCLDGLSKGIYIVNGVKVVK